MKALMVQGTSSWAGKSLLATALCRYFARRGVRVAPFKGQNMSNNARVVAGGEIGSAQYLQALAAGVEPTVAMNPVLVKPEAENRSQVVVRGRPDLDLSRRAWTERPAVLWPVIEDSFRGLLDEYELVVVEGAGSPAEINLRQTDLANMRLAKLAQAPVLLVADVNRGGAFAHLYGTWALLEPDEQRLIGAFVLNKFRGDQTLLGSGPARLEELTGVPSAGVLPWLAHGLPDEDGAAQPAGLSGGRPLVVIVRYPTASNLDEFKPLEQSADVRFASQPSDLEAADLVVLPGSKHVAADLEWLRRTGLDTELTARAKAGGRVLAICGGMQMLGESIDGAGVEDSGRGLGLLPLRTVFAPGKITRATTTRFGDLPEPWRSLSGLEVDGYEIRHGRTQLTGTPLAALPGGLGVTVGPLLAVYLHGLFEQPDVLTALVGGSGGGSGGGSLEQVFDQLADALEAHLDTQLIDELAGLS